MSALREAVLLEMRLRGFSPRTHESYIFTMEALARRYRRPPEVLTCAEVQVFLDELIMQISGIVDHSFRKLLTSDFGGK